MILKKTPQQIEAMRRAGAALARVFAVIGPAIGPGVILSDVDALAAEAIRNQGGEPSFLGYRGFPASICASPNHVIVHGIPDQSTLKDGDIVSIDIGLIVDGWHADRAITYPVGEVTADARQLLDVTERALTAAIDQCRPGRHLGDLGAEVEALAEAAGFTVAREYSGHGIGRAMHEDPQVPNYGISGRGLRLEEGMVFALEPMINAGGWRSKILDDGWTVITSDGALSAHFEHTVAVTARGPLVLTAPEA